MNKENVIKELVAIWYSLMIDHHKDRDCHFYLNAHYKYDGQAVYIVEHFGYVYHHYEREFDNLSNAQDFLIAELHRAIVKECNSYIDMIEDESGNFQEEVDVLDLDKTFFLSKLRNANDIAKGAV